jgi:hypothetical protein
MAVFFDYLLGKLRVSDLDPTLISRITQLENNEYKITYYAEISTDTGTITKPTGSTILLDQFFGGVDAYVSTIAGGQPTGNFPTTAGGIAVDVSSFDAMGDFTLSDTPSSYPVALIYILKIKAQDYSNLDISKILDLENANAVPYTGATQDVDLGTNDLIFGDGAGILLDNGSRLRKGTIDALTGGSKGIAQICAVGYELKWEAGRLYVMDGNGLLIRHSLHNFNIVPSVNEDDTKGYYVGSLWTLDDGTTYICSDSTTGAATWDLYYSMVPSLQQVTDIDSITTNTITVGDVTADFSELGASAIGVQNAVTGTYSYFDSSGNLGLHNGDEESNLKNTNVTNAGVILEFPDKATGSYTIATTSDIPDASLLVPYTGATSDVDLGEYELKAGQIEFDQSPTGTSGVAVMRWNDTDGTLDLGLKGGNVTLQVGQEQIVRVVNKTATNVNLLEANYQAVRVTGAQGQRLKVDLALATNDVLSAETIGLVTETINNNQEGFITTSGLVRGINTTGSLQGETWADGNILYLSPTTAGNITNIKPTAPNHIVIIGYVVSANITQGSIYVKVDNGYELEELHNVTSTNYTTPIDTDSVLTYDVTNDIWKRLTLANLRADVLDGFNTVNLIRQEFTYTSGPQTFTLSNSASAVYSVFVNGQELRQSQYTVVTTTLTIIDTLEASDRVDVIYSNATLGINPSYTKAESDTLLNAKVTSNSAITGATKTKVTYDAKGLVTSGADATTADIAASTNKNYVTDAQAIVIGNTSGTNSGDVSVTDGSTIDFTLTGQALTAEVKDSSITEAKQLLADNTTNDVSTSKHGYAPKLPNDATKFLDGTGTYSTPAGGGGGSSATSNLFAYYNFI